MKRAREKLLGMLKVAGLPKKASYNPEEVCRLLGISGRSFRRHAAAFEPTADGAPLSPDGIETFTTPRGHKRVRFDELVDYLDRNNLYNRLHAHRPKEPVQMGLFD